MFGFVIASLEELSEEQKNRYQSVYCGICRAIREADGQLCRLGLSYDMAFLALLLMSLYEPDEENGRGRCIAHPAKARPWTDNEYIRYAARLLPQDDGRGSRTGQKARFHRTGDGS